MGELCCRCVKKKPGSRSSWPFLMPWTLTSPALVLLWRLPWYLWPKHCRGLVGGKLVEILRIFSMEENNTHKSCRKHGTTWNSRGNIRETYSICWGWFYPFASLLGGKCFSMKLVKIELLKHHIHEVQESPQSPHTLNCPTWNMQGLPSNVSELAEGLISHPHEGLDITWDEQNNWKIGSVSLMLWSYGCAGPKPPP